MVAGAGGGDFSGMDRRRVAELLGIVSKAMAELAEEFDEEREGDPSVAAVRPTRRRRRERVMPVPMNVSDLDVAAARRALRRAGI